jgi:hypothetical protein
MKKMIKIKPKLNLNQKSIMQKECKLKLNQIMQKGNNNLMKKKMSIQKGIYFI